MVNYRRAQQPGGTFFFTVVLQDRTATLLTDYIADLRNAFVVVRNSQPFRIDAIVVLPDHLHCIWTLPIGDADFSSRWRRIKASFSRHLHHRGERYTRNRYGEQAIWQKRFWEHMIRDANDWKHHVDYIHFNPCKHGLVNQVRDWPYSSFHNYVANGFLSVDWGDDIKTPPQKYGE